MKNYNEARLSMLIEDVVEMGREDAKEELERLDLNKELLGIYLEVREKIKLQGNWRASESILEMYSFLNKALLERKEIETIKIKNAEYGEIESEKGKHFTVEYGTGKDIGLGVLRNLKRKDSTIIKDIRDNEGNVLEIVVIK